jgi:quaternary ammonium compound-resistance protein SugE
LEEDEKHAAFHPSSNPQSEIPNPQSRSLLMAWLYLLVAGLMEVGWAVGLKYTEGFTRLWPSVGTAVALVLSMVLLAAAMRTLPLGTAYAIWTGIGAVGTAALGIILFGESASAARLACIALIVAGLVGLKLTSAD